MGLGLSSRPHPKHFSLKQKHDSDAARAAHAEAFFLDPLLEFFDLKKITTANLVAHSLGGYLALAFALKEPTRVENLILLSPAGIPVYPFGEAGEKADKGKGKEEQEAKVEDAVEMETGFGVGSASGSGSGSASGTEDDEEDEELKTGDKKPQAFKGPTGDSGKLMKSLYSWMWEVSPSSQRPAPPVQGTSRSLTASRLPFLLLVPTDQQVTTASRPLDGPLRPAPARQGSHSFEPPLRLFFIPLTCAHCLPLSIRLTVSPPSSLPRNATTCPTTSPT